MCGVLGIWSNEAAFPHLYHGLLGLQHRGQDSAGIITYDGRFHTKKGNGLVRDIFRPEHTRRLTGPIGIGHTRYPTIGGGGGEDAQPFQLGMPFGIIMAHNGNVVNYAALKSMLFQKYRRLLDSDNDVETILNVFALAVEEEHPSALLPEQVFRAVERVYAEVIGAYSVVAYVAEQGMVAFRDPFGIKPLVWGLKRDGVKPSVAFASESVSLNIMGFNEIHDVGAGQAVWVDRDRDVHIKTLDLKQASPCLFEWVYFARPDSFIDEANVYRVRHRLGELLADDIRALNLPIDIVVPVPDSARDAAIEIARRLNLRYREALVKNRYIGRTFIMPGQAERAYSVRLKLNPIVPEFKGKDILLVDDSIVRGTTSREIVAMVRACGARRVYFASTAPPLRFPCVYGIDMQTRTEFVARNRDLAEIAASLGADRVIYQSLDNLKAAVRAENPNLTHFCAACFDGDYIMGSVTPELVRAVEDERRGVRAGQLELDLPE